MTCRLRIVKPEDQKILEALLAKSDTPVDPYAFGETTYWFVESEAGEILGYTGIHSVNWVSRRCRGMLWVEPNHRGNGIGEAALRQRNAIVFDQYNMNRIEWATPSTNEPMKAVAAKLGACHEGTLRQVQYFDGKYQDYDTYALLKEEVR